jgi:hypothetical protein
MSMGSKELLLVIVAYMVLWHWAGLLTVVLLLFVIRVAAFLVGLIQT